MSKIDSIPSDFPGMTSENLDSYILDFLNAVYGKEVRDKLARISYLIGHQIKEEAATWANSARINAENADNFRVEALNAMREAEKSETAAASSEQNASQSATNAANSATAAKTAQTAAEAAQEAAENAAQTATDAAGGDFLPKSGGKMSGDIDLGNHSIGHIARLFGSSSTANYIQFLIQGCGGTVTRICGTNYSGEAQSVEAGNGVVSLNSTGAVNLNSGTGTITANSKRIQSVAAPIAETDAANKAFVEESTQNVESSKKLSSAQTIDGVAFDGSSSITHYGTCSTAAATAVKVVQCDGFKLVTGARIAVKFSNANTAASPTLNVNGTGAKRLCKHGTFYVGNDWHDDEVVEFVYDGTQYQMVGTKLTVSYQDVEFKPYESTRSGNYFNVHAEKYGRVVTLCVSSIIQFPSASFSGTLDTVTIPADFRPTTNQYVHGMGISGSSQLGNFRARFNTDGTVTMVVPDARLAERHFTITYITSDGAVS